MEPLTKEEFYKRLFADPRDIMPSHEEPMRTLWRVVRTRELFAVTTPGWKNPGDPETFFIVGKENDMRYGTNHFISEDAALTYYEPYGYDRGDIAAKIARGEIAIGMPEPTATERPWLHPEEGRYFMEPDPLTAIRERRDRKRAARLAAS